ncbi:MULTISPECIES: DUF4810 domain-containing protein [unclassified Acinetobacter]|uniref:DUF4810 domain-containing protein n=1 Tax=unclassified Acinetobacter TaxID=196816 RepID=UPI00293462CB|nr:MULTISPECIES: DUF4810 domain-containing protein [unclassified Acinetobacter]WOE31376.1 DUF4810 domain-containing protein [Acinetobacter sp. SAAs470]WOE39572.1 DUF4810 domain-containing protein [Acinetobacter sp. SAAs474]
MKRLKMLMVGLFPLVMAGCMSQTAQPLYYWGSYPQQSYLLMSKPEKISIEAQITLLEKDLEKAKAHQQAVPPGFYAHLGLLNLDIHHTARAIEYFRLERQTYPESATLMDYLLNKMMHSSGSKP